MLNYTLDKEKSKTFVKFYEKQGNDLRIHYGNKTTHIVPNTEETKKRLNQIMEGQLNDPKIDKRMSEEEVNFHLSMIAAGGAGVVGFVGVALNATIFPIICVGVASLFSVAGIHSWKLVRDYKKNISFLNYKEEIQDYLTVDDESLELNPVKKEVFTINDTHFISCRDMKKMTNDIKSVLNDMKTSEQRDLELGISREKPTFKQKVKELKRG